MKRVKEVICLEGFQFMGYLLTSSLRTRQVNTLKQTEYEDAAK